MYVQGGPPTVNWQISAEPIISHKNKYQLEVQGIPYKINKTEVNNLNTFYDPFIWQVVLYTIRINTETIL